MHLQTHAPASCNHRLLCWPIAWLPPVSRMGRFCFESQLRSYDSKRGYCAPVLSFRTVTLSCNQADKVREFGLAVVWPSA